MNVYEPTSCPQLDATAQGWSLCERGWTKHFLGVGNLITDGVLLRFLYNCTIVTPENPTLSIKAPISIIRNCGDRDDSSEAPFLATRKVRYGLRAEATCSRVACSG